MTRTVRAFGAACTVGGGEPAEARPWGEPSTTQGSDPYAEVGLQVFPADGAGLAAPDGTPGPAGPLGPALDTLDGYGTSAAVVVRLPEAVTEVGEEFRLVERSGDQGERDLAFEASLHDEGHAALLWPLVPLRPGALHGVRVPGGCTEFTTQTIWQESVAVAADVATRNLAWSAREGCVDDPGEGWRECAASFRAGDYRRDGVVAGAEPVVHYDLAVHAWLPREGTGPWPLVVFGHGLTGERRNGRYLARVLAPAGFAVIALDAPWHGEHGAGAGGGEIDTLLRFFGIDLGTMSLQPLPLRDHWRQATYDKLQLLRLIAADADVDGDGEADVDPSAVAYFGESLGGVMGPELLALTDAVGAAVLAVPGGRVSSIIQYGEEFQLIVNVMRPPGVGDGDVARYFALLQLSIDRGDAANYAPYVLRDRLPGAGTRVPHLLHQMVIGDQYIPNVSNRVLARALGLPTAEPVLQDVGNGVSAGALPLRGNLPGGTTAATVQFDTVVRDAGGEPETARHTIFAESHTALEQARHFFVTWRDTGVAEIR